MVQAEVFHLWVIEHPDNMSCAALRREFPAERAGLNVLIAESEAPYHERKVTLLNGPHTVLSPVAYLSGIDIVRDALHDKVIGQYIRKVQFDELMQTLNLPMAELQQFGADVLERFDNPYVDHAVTSIMLNSFPKFETRDLPGLKVYLQRHGQLPKGLVLGLAAIITYYRGGTRADGAPIQPNDAPAIIDRLTQLWATGDTRQVAEGVLASTDVIWKGAESLLMQRCASQELLQQTIALINDFKEYFLSHGEPCGENPSPGNKAGGISTLEEKALGCTQKSGSSPVRGVLSYGDRLERTGLHLLSAPGNDLVASTALAAAGCQLILFTTGRGTPFGTFVPTVKVSTNSQLAHRKPHWIDFDAGPLLEDHTMDQLLPQFIQTILDVASGQLTASERAHIHDLAIFKTGVTL